MEKLHENDEMKVSNPSSFAECAKEPYSEEIANIIQNVLTMLGGKWKVLIVYHLGASGMCRFGELRKRIPAVTQKMLTAALREMEGDGVVERKVYAEVPPRVEYRLTEVGAELHYVYRAMADWGIKHSGVVDKRCGEMIEVE